MKKINWCLKQKTGIQLVEESENLKEAHLKKAEEALETLQSIKNKDWKITTAYYTIYHGIYSLLREIGIKCEIHSCTIHFAKTFLKNHFSKKDFELIDKAFSARIDAQYYTNKEITNEKYELIINNAAKLLITCKNIQIKEEEKEEIRKKLK